jgi:hypothetical protein
MKILSILLCCTLILGETVFRDQIHHTGWDELEIRINSDVSDKQKCYELGYSEGFHTPYKKTEASFWNWISDQFGPDHPTHLDPSVTEFIKSQVSYMESQILQFSADPYWLMVECVLTQFEAMYDGYLAQCERAGH